METFLIALSAAVAIGLTGLATGFAQARIGSAGVGVIAEKPETFGSVVIMLVIPETIVIFGFTIAILILFALK